MIGRAENARRFGERLARCPTLTKTGWPKRSLIRRIDCGSTAASFVKTSANNSTDCCTWVLGNGALHVPLTDASLERTSSSSKVGVKGRHLELHNGNSGCGITETSLILCRKTCFWVTETSRRFCGKTSCWVIDIFQGFCRRMSCETPQVSCRTKSC